MAIEIESGASADIATVDPTTKAIRISPRPLEYGAGGSYRVALRSGTLAATLAANGLLYSFRFGNNAGLLAVIHQIRAQLFANLAFTAAFNDMSLQAFITRAYTANDTVGAGSVLATLSGNNGKKRTSHGTSLLNTDGQARIAGTAVLSGGTGTDDANPFAVSQAGKPNVVNAAAGTEELAPQPIITLDYEAVMGDGAHPHVFAANEGFRIRNGPVVWPAAGTGVLVVQVDWSEVPLSALTS